MSKKEDKETLFCSFCGKSQKEVKITCDIPDDMKDLEQNLL